MPSIFLQRDIQRVDRFQIQVVRRFVQHQNVRLLQHQPAENQPRLLRRPKALRRLLAPLRLETASARGCRESPRVRRRINRCSQSTTVSPVLDRRAYDPARSSRSAPRGPSSPSAIEREILVLEPSDNSAIAAALQQRRFARAVAADEADLFAAQNIAVKSVDHRHARHTLRQALELQHMLAVGRIWSKRDNGR